MKKLFTALIMLAISIPVLAEEQFSVSTGFDFSSGKYGNATSTDILYIPVTGKYDSDNMTLKLTVPYIRITGPGGVVQGVGQVGTAAGATKTTNSGLGDVVASADYSFYADDSLELDVVGKVKFGTADANKELGTGKNSYSAQLDGYYTLDKTTIFATAGYKIYDAPIGYAMNNVPYGTIGTSQKLSGSTSAGAMLDVAKSANTASADQVEATVYISHKIASKLKIQANVMKGFANGSPDFGGGAMITSYF